MSYGIWLGRIACVSMSVSIWGLGFFYWFLGFFFPFHFYDFNGRKRSSKTVDIKKFLRVFARVLKVGKVQLKDEMKKKIKKIKISQLRYQDL